MNLVEKSFVMMYPKWDIDFKSSVKYSKAFKGYNANVRYTKESINFRLSHKWNNIAEDIKIGLIQTLLNRRFDTKVETFNIDLYNIFIKKVTLVAPRTKVDPHLETIFIKINEEYFDGLLTVPNLEFGGENFHTLGTYDHMSDTIRISRLLTKDKLLLEYVMYHEMLHKKLKYKNRKSRIIHHSKEFREMEKKFKDKDIEKKLQIFVKKEKTIINFKKTLL